MSGVPVDVTDCGALLAMKTKTFTSNTCLDFIYTTPEFYWLDKDTWFVRSGEGDVYYYKFKNGFVKHLGGTFNLGVSIFKLNEKGNLVFSASDHGIWSFSSDTGKSWISPLMKIKTKVVQAEFSENSIYILASGKIFWYTYGNNQLDTSLYKKDVFVERFYVRDKFNLIVFIKSTSYNYNLKTKEISPLGPFTQFKNLGYLKRSKKFVFVSNVFVLTSADFGKTWSKSTIVADEDFTSLVALEPIDVIEEPNNNIYIKVIFNDKPAMLHSKDGGISFVVRHDMTQSSTGIMCIFNNNLYSYNSDNLLLFNNLYNNTVVLDRYKGHCSLAGIHAYDSGIILWNNRAEIYILEGPYKPVFPPSEIFKCFPNPAYQGSELNIQIPKQLFADLRSIEMSDVLGNKLGNLFFEFSSEQNAWKVKSLPNAPGIYFILIRTTDGSVFRHKLIIN